MPVDVQTEIVIDRPCAEVAGYAGDPAQAPHWYANIESVGWQTPPPVRAGAGRIRRPTSASSAGIWVIAAASLSVVLPPLPPKWSMVSRRPGWRSAIRPMAGRESVASSAMGTSARSAASQSQSSVPSASQPRSGSFRNP